MQFLFYSLKHEFRVRTSDICPTCFVKVKSKLQDANLKHADMGCGIAWQLGGRMLFFSGVSYERSDCGIFY